MKAVEIVPHGLCNGVRNAVAKALELKDAYCLHELVHNETILEDLEVRGFRFVDSVEEVPEGAAVVFPAHGVAPAVRALADTRRLKVVDLTCPSVAKAHRAVREALKRGDEVIVLGDHDHTEVQGLLGEFLPVSQSPNLPISQSNNQTIKQSNNSQAPLTVVCQTSMDVDEARRQVLKLSEGREHVEVCWPCEATKARQDAVRAFAKTAEEKSENHAVLVLGSERSANTKRLLTVARDAGSDAFLASTVAEVKALECRLERYAVVGITSGASTPESLFASALAALTS